MQVGTYRVALGQPLFCNLTGVETIEVIAPYQ
jgi:hypothetical protein